MSVNYAPSFIDAIFERRDALALYSIISVRSRHSVLPDECALFNRMLEWLGSDWQYYEGLQEDDYREVCRLLTKFGMLDVLAKYQEGRLLPLQSVDFMDWFDQHESEIKEQLFRHAERATDFLKKNEA